MPEKDSFKFPSNVKQIGNIDDSFRIYVEDFAYTYIAQYAKSESYKEKLGVLVGEYIEQEGKNVIIISGVIQAKHSQNVDGSETFTEETWEYINSRKDRYFKDLKIVGWLHTQPPNSTYLSDEDRNCHYENFREVYNVLFLIDMLEKQDMFFVLDEKADLRGLEGYFIYYDKNENMQEYMIDNKLVKTRAYSGREEENDEKEDVALTYKRHEKAKRSEQHQKKVVNMLVCTSGIVVMLCFVMGLILAQNAERMANMEMQLVSVNNSYIELAQIQAAAVFATQETKLIQNNKDMLDEDLTNLELEESKFIAQLEGTDNLNDSSQSIQQSQTAISDEEKQTTENQGKEKQTTSNQETTIQETTQETKSANTDAKIKEEQATTEVKKESISKTYIVKAGDTLSEICTKHYGDNNRLKEIMLNNNIQNADKIYIGMTLILP